MFATSNKKNSRKPQQNTKKIATYLNALLDFYIEQINQAIS
jgi:hypothetical protein